MCVCVFVVLCVYACLSYGFITCGSAGPLTTLYRLDYPMNRCVRDSGLLWLDFQSLGSRTWLLGLGLWCSADQSCYRDSRLMLFGVCWVGRGEE